MEATNYSIDTLEDFCGREMGTSDWVEVEQPIINAFADCTGDQQWIHVDPERARTQSPFGTTIAHGYLTLAMLAKFQMEIGLVPGDAQQAFNYGIDSVRFLAPVPAGARVRGRATIDSIERRDKGGILMKTTNTVEIENSDKPALIAQTLILLH